MPHITANRAPCGVPDSAQKGAGWTWGPTRGFRSSHWSGMPGGGRRGHDPPRVRHPRRGRRGWQPLGRRGSATSSRVVSGSRGGHRLKRSRPRRSAVRDRGSVSWDTPGGSPRRRGRELARRAPLRPVVDWHGPRRCHCGWGGRCSDLACRLRRGDRLGPALGGGPDLGGGLERASTFVAAGPVTWREMTRQHVAATRPH